MKSPRHTQPLLCTLLCLVLLHAFAFSLHSGQMAGLGLALSGGAYCSLQSGGAGFGHAAGGDEHTASLGKPCPLCSGGHAAIHGLWALALRDAPPADRHAGVPAAAPFLAAHWPDANPRASPRYA